MIKGVPYKPPRGYGGLKKIFSFYMILPDGKAISIDRRDFVITSPSKAMEYLKLLDQHVTPVLIDSLESAEAMGKQIEAVISKLSDT